MHPDFLEMQASHVAWVASTSRGMSFDNRKVELQGKRKGVANYRRGVAEGSTSQCRIWGLEKERKGGRQLDKERVFDVTDIAA
jgi:hypothetical protein